MATHNWIILSGSATWQAASFDSGILPATGDTVNIVQGSADINAGLNQSAVTLAALNWGPGFTGTVGTTGTSGDNLQIGATTETVNCGSGRIKRDQGTTNHTTVIISTGVAKDTGLESFRLIGGGASSKLYVVGTNSNTSVGIATTRGGQTATLAEFDSRGGTLNIGSGVTLTNGYQSGGSNVIVNCGATLLSQSHSQAVLTTSGSAAVTTIIATGTVNINNRPAAGTDAVGTLNLGTNATADFTGDPRPAALTNAPLLASGSKFYAFSPTQLTMHGGGSLILKCQQCGLSDVTIDMGSQVQATLTGW